MKQKMFEKRIVIIDCRNEVKQWWDYLMMFLALYTAIYVPYRTAFMSYETSSLLTTFELITDALFFVDVLITFFTSYERMDGSYETKLKKICTNYLFGNFFIDILAILPQQILT